MVINLELTWPPSLNKTYAGRAGGGALYMKKEAKDWKDTQFWLIRQQLPHDHKPFKGDLVLRVRLTPPDNRKADADNRLKLIQDALQLGRVFEDDCQIKRLEVDWLAAKKPGFVRLAVCPFEQ